MQTYDLVIIGGGAAGLAAAHMALACGVERIALLEALKKTGGNSAMAGGFLYAPGTPLIEANGVNNTVQELKAALDFHHYDYVNPALIRRWLDEVKNTVSWLESRGFAFKLSPTGEGYTIVMADSPGVSWFHRVLRPLQQELASRGVAFFHETKATRIETDETGAVCGVCAVHDGAEQRFPAKNVLLSCGGFLANPQLLEQYFPQYYEKDSFYQVVPSDGNGIALAAGAGAKVNGECTLVKESGMCFKPGPRAPGRIFAAEGSVYVNRLGRRYVDESLWNQNYSANALLMQPGRVGFALYSSETLADALSQPMFAGDRETYEAYLQKAADEGVECCFADTLTGLAEWIGADAAVLEQTVADYNGYCETGVDLEFVKPATQLRPLRTGPYLAVRIRPMYIDTIGPVVINEHMQVLDPDDRPIPGFFAAGVITAGWEGSDYMRFGSALSYSTTSGRMAGMSIAERGVR